MKLTLMARRTDCLKGKTGVIRFGVSRNHLGKTVCFSLPYSPIRDAPKASPVITPSAHENHANKGGQCHQANSGLETAGVFGLLSSSLLLKQLVNALFFFGKIVFLFVFLGGFLCIHLRHSCVHGFCLYTLCLCALCLCPLFAVSAVVDVLML